MGVDTNSRLWMSPNFNGVQKYVEINTGTGTTPSSTISTSVGLWMGNRTASNSSKLFLNGSVNYSHTTVSSALPTSAIFLSARNTAPAANYSSAQVAFASIGDGLTDTEAANLYTAVQAYQTTLGRSVGTQTVSDADAQAFVNAAVIEDQVQATAINTLVTDLKGYGIWTKMKAIYPFVGGTASTHKWNLKDPRDLDAAFRLVFSGGWTHSSTGALPNGTNAYANTYFNPATNSLSYNNNHLSYYSRTSASATNAIYEIGSGDSTDGGTGLFLRRANNTAAYDSGSAVNPGNRLLVSGVTNAQGLYTGTSITTNIGYLFKNGVQQQIKNPLNNIAMKSYNYYLGGFNEQNTTIYYSNKECAFASIGNGLTTTEAANLYTAVQAYQTTLSRNV
jgi:hypothetical protein